jgi:hypothetical protein
VAVYKACSRNGCTSSAVLKAIDGAVSDGVDVISISIGAGDSSQQAKFLDDPIALGVVNTAPWILSVAASTIDRAFRSSIILGKGSVAKVITPFANGS